MSTEMNGCGGYENDCYHRNDIPPTNPFEPEKNVLFTIQLDGRSFRLLRNLDRERNFLQN